MHPWNLTWIPKKCCFILKGRFSFLSMIWKNSRAVDSILLFILFVWGLEDIFWESSVCDRSTVIYGLATGSHLFIKKGLYKKHQQLKNHGPPPKKSAFECYAFVCRCDYLFSNCTNVDMKCSFCWKFISFAPLLTLPSNTPPPPPTSHRFLHTKWYSLQWKKTFSVPSMFFGMLQQ